MTVTVHCTLEREQKKGIETLPIQKDVTVPEGVGLIDFCRSEVSEPGWKVVNLQIHNKL